MWIIGSNQWDGKYTTGFSAGKLLCLQGDSCLLAGRSRASWFHVHVCLRSHTGRGTVSIVTADCGALSASSQALTTLHPDVNLSPRSNSNHENGLPISAVAGRAGCSARLRADDHGPEHGHELCHSGENARLEEHRLCQVAGTSAGSKPGKNRSGDC